MIAHEFSHILNGDMRLNIRLMGVLFGILVIGLTGWIIFRSSMGGGYVRVGARDDDRKGFNPIPLIGLALYVIGYVGVFFGNLIKAAVSRQREFLADASAVQFTRNPDGIAGALKKIGALAEGSHVNDSHAEEASHMFFGEAVSGLNELFGLLSTHPPLVERIRRIDPSFTGDFSQVRLDRIDDPAPDRVRSIPGVRSGLMGLTAAGAVARVGTIDQAHIDYAGDLKESIPKQLAHAVRDPLGCPGDDLRPLARSRRTGSRKPARVARCVCSARRDPRDAQAGGRCPAPRSRGSPAAGRNGCSRALPDDAGAVSRIPPLRRGPGPGRQQADSVRICTPAALDPARRRAFRRCPAVHREIHDHPAARHAGQRRSFCAGVRRKHEPGGGGPRLRGGRAGPGLARCRS